MSSTTTEDRTALVTGASSGIGRELANVIAADGYDLVVTARREERLRTLAEAVEADHGVEVTAIPQDLAAPDAADNLYEAVLDAGIDVHTLVNNAGVPVYGSFTDTDWDDERDMLQVNVVALTALTKRFVPDMVERGDGAVLNTASLASFYPIPTKAVYAATKSYALSFSRALAHDLADEGITVTALCPGPVETEYATRGDVEESNTMAGVTNDARSVAEAGWEGLTSGQRVVFPSAFATYGAQLTRVLPRTTVTKLGERSIEEGASWV
jgi:short-subunit dehydrogenase